MNNQLDIIQQLKEKPFSSLSLQEKIEIMQAGRPCPPLTDMVSCVRDRHREYKRQFRVTNYAYFNWMCGSENLKKLFCWPCLLFGTSFSSVGSNVLKEAQDAGASTSATPSADPPTIAAPKSKAQKQREYRQRIAATRTSEQAIAARKSDAERQRICRLRKAGSLKSTRPTASSSHSGARPKKNVWVSTGFDNLAGLINSAKSHELSGPHAVNVSKMAEFEQKRLNGIWDVMDLDQAGRGEVFIKTETENGFVVSYDDPIRNLTDICEGSSPACQNMPPDKKRKSFFTLSSSLDAGVKTVYPSCPPVKLETEFDLWARSVAHQLNNMDLKTALQLQLKMQQLLTEDRISQD